MCNFTMDLSGLNVAENLQLVALLNDKSLTPISRNAI